MPDVRALLEQRLQAAFDAVAPGADPVLRASDRADFQANGALALAKQLGQSPRQVAELVLAETARNPAARLDDVCSTVEVSGPGFVNLTLSDEFIVEHLQAAAGDRLGAEPAAEPLTYVVDYSSPNVAKEMHVGHLRTTVIGDSLARLLTFAGHHVVRENHLGDWGTPFGMLIEHLLDIGEEEAAHELSVGDLDMFYKQARASYDADPAFAERSRQRVVALQSGDAETLRLWHRLVAESLAYFDQVYAKLGVLLTDDDVRGESAYNPMLTQVVDDLAAAGLLVKDDGALCVFPGDQFVNRDGHPLPLIVQKADGGFGYAATDLAAIRDRVDRLGARRLLYVVGAPQAQHFDMVFAAARLAGWLPDDAQAIHVSFGSVLGQDHKMLRSRSADGTELKLVGLLDEAVDRAAATIAERGYDVAEADRPAVAEALGIGAVKYADLSTERTRDYVFDLDRMLAGEGNTGPYLQYAHARIRSIFRHAGTGDPGLGAVAVTDPHERALAKALLFFGDAVREAIDGCAPSKLCSYLFDLASTYSAFYVNCPVLRAPDAATRDSRLALSGQTARVLATGMGLLGMEAPERM